MPDDTCGTCKFSLVRDVPPMLCIRYPPVALSESGHSGWPGTMPHYRCGEFVAAPLPPPPVNVDVPAATPFGTAAAGDTLSCTTGNWNNTPTSYAYQWKRDATNVGTNQSAYTVGAMDAGRTLTCVVTATNAGGSAIAPPSNGIAIPAATRATRQ